MLTHIRAERTLTGGALAPGLSEQWDESVSLAIEEVIGASARQSRPILIVPVAGMSVVAVANLW
jgi:hypothetical protein